MSVSRVIEVSFGNETVVYVNIDTAYYYNDGVIIKPTDGDLPDTYQVHWADSPESNTTLETIGTSEGVPIPDELWGRSKVIYGWFYLHPTEDSSVTYKEIRIYKSARAGLPDGTEPTPSEHSTIDQLISAMNTAADSAEQNADSASSDADRAETARNEAESYATAAQTSASNAEASATTATNQAQIATTSATTATTAAQTATTKATEASNSASSAAESASSASDSADSASRSEQAAKISETNAADSESNASTYANSARGYAQTAQSASASASSSAASASNSATSASNSATSASQSASVATEAKADIEGMVESARGYANASAQSASQASASEQGCARAVLDAASAAAIARARAEEASGYAQTASTKASEAVGCVETATQKATESAQSASQALGYKNDAESAKTASQTAQGLAESAKDSAISAKNDAESARDDAESARDEAVSAVTSISGALSEKAPIITDTASGAIASFSDGADDLPLKSLVVDINPIQDLSNGDPSPENLCPISGWDEVNVQRTGKNLFSFDPAKAKTGTTDAGTIRAYCPLGVSNCTLSFSAELIDSGSVSTATINIGKLKDGKLSALNSFIWPNGITKRTVTFSENEQAVLMTSDSSVTSIITNIPKYHICVTTGSTPQSYEPYTGRSITIDLGQTVYGGKLDVLSGELVVDRASVDLGTLDWARSSERFYSLLSPVAKPSGNYNVPVNAVCSAYKNLSQNAVYAKNIGIAIQSLAGNSLYVYDPKYTDASAFKSAMNGVQLCYELATPLEIQLDAHTLNSLYGVNNIWADTGDTEVEYRADTKLFIERLTAPDSADMIADANITSGQYFMVGNSLYKATANIANGSAIVVGTNCIRKSLSEALNEINA